MCLYFYKLINQNQEILSLVTIPNVLINTVNIPAEGDIAKNGTFETEIEFSSIDPSKTRFWYGDWDSLSVSIYKYIFYYFIIFYFIFSFIYYNLIDK